MIVLGADMHKGSHTVAAVAAVTGEVLGEKTVRVGEQGFVAARRGARSRGKSDAIDALAIARAQAAAQRPDVEEMVGLDRPDGGCAN